MSEPQPMDFRTARSRADQVCAWLAPYCESILAVGSIRRERPVCNDIDVVCVPKFDRRQPLAGCLPLGLEGTSTERVNLLREFLLEYVRLNTDAIRPKWLGRKGATGPEPRPDAQNLLLITSKGVQLDAWCATAETLVTRTICRTGSVAHNIWAAQRADQLHGHWNPYEGLTLHGEKIPLATELDFYTALNLPYVRPQDREQDFLDRIWRPQ